MDRLCTTILYRTYARFQNDAHRKDQLPQLKQKGREGNGDVRNGRGKGVWLRCHTFSELNILFSSKIKCTLLSWWQLFFHSSSRKLSNKYYTVQLWPRTQGNPFFNHYQNIMEGNLAQSELLQFIYGYFLMNEFHCESEHRLQRQRTEPPHLVCKHIHDFFRPVEFILVCK